MDVVVINNNTRIFLIWKAGKWQSYSGYRGRMVTLLARQHFIFTQAYAPVHSMQWWTTWGPPSVSSMARKTADCWVARIYRFLFAFFSCQDRNLLPIGGSDHVQDSSTQFWNATTDGKLIAVLLLCPVLAGSFAGIQEQIVSRLQETLLERKAQFMIESLQLEEEEDQVSQVTPGSVLAISVGLGRRKWNGCFQKL